MSMSIEETVPTDEEVKYEFEPEFQLKIATHVLRDEMFMRQASHLIFPEHFEDVGVQWLVNKGIEHYRRFEQTPSLSIIHNDLLALKKTKRIKDDVLAAVIPAVKSIYGEDADVSSRDYMVEQVAFFAKQQAYEREVLRAAEALASGAPDFSKIIEGFNQAAQIGSVEEGVAFEFWSSADNRAEVRQERLRSGVKTGITTGHKELDDALAEGGWGRGEMSILMGPPKSGKSIGLGEFAINATMAGHNVLYLSLENSAKVVGDRMDANVSEVKMRDLSSSPSKVTGAIKSKAEKVGKLWIHEFPTGTMTPSDIRRLVSKYQSQGYAIDMIVIDYADIMAPDYRTGAENTDSKQIYTSIRAIGQQNNCAILTATQTNRDGAKATVAKFTDVSEDINRVRLADAFLILAATDSEKADDIFRLYLAAMRNSESGVMFTCKSDRARMKFIKGMDKSAL